MTKLKLTFTLCLLAFLTASCQEDNTIITIKDPELDNPVEIDYTYKMGINLNEQVDVADYQDLADSQTKWVRCFIEVIDVYKAGTLDTDAKVAAFNALKSKGYNTVLSLKFNFKKHGFPAVNSADWTNYLNFIQPFLAKVMPYTDVLIVGNEPFIEAERADWNEPLNTFYKAACERTNNYFKLNNIQKPIFLGAMVELFGTANQNDAGHNAMLTFIKSTDYLAGVDIHIHHSAIEEITAALNFVKGKIREDQKILVTEFSLMRHWRNNNNVDISAAFLTKANESTTDKIFPPPTGVTKNYQYIDYALKNPRPAEEWYAFWENSPYLFNRRSYLCNASNLYKAAGNVFLAFYALRQSYPLNTDFTVNTDPWVLNGLFMNRSVELLNGRSQKSYSYYDQFVKIVNEEPCN
jgi:hypothetical protein